MAHKSKIEWTEATWNPWHGCKKVSPGCKYCYMFRDKEKYGQDGSIVERSKTRFNDPLKWKEGRMIFTCSWSDWFIEQSDAWRNEAWEIIKNTPQHTYQILTKRPERIKDCLPKDWGQGYPNVWLGVSVESNEQFHRIYGLSTFDAKIKFVSFEPLIGWIDQVEIYVLSRYIDWVIIGGESGNNQGKYKFRPCSIHWIDEIMEVCDWEDIPVFVKQLGTHISELCGFKDRHGKDMSEWPEHLRVRQMPKHESLTLSVPPPKDVTVCPECLRPCDQDELDIFGGLCEDCIPTL